MGGKSQQKRSDASGVRRMLRGDGTKKRQRVSSQDLFGEGYSGDLMQGRYSERDDVHKLIQKRHRGGYAWVDSGGEWNRNGHTWKVPYGVRVALKTPLTHSQVVNKYPWYATWVSPSGKRFKKKCVSLGAAIDFVASRAQYVDPQASVISRHGFYIPTKLMGKFPRRSRSGRLYYWCPCCMQPRTFRRMGDQFFYANKKFWSQEKGYYEWKNVKLAVLVCTVCGLPNRDHKFRASNQPLEKRRFKPGVRRARRRKR